MKKLLSLLGLLFYILTSFAQAEFTEEVTEYDFTRESIYDKSGNKLKKEIDYEKPVHFKITDKKGSFIIETKEGKGVSKVQLRYKILSKAEEGDVVTYTVFRAAKRKNQIIKVTQEAITVFGDENMQSPVTYNN